MPAMRFFATVTALLAMQLGIASAHIHLTSPLSRTDAAGGDPQKAQHCGGTPGRIAGRVQTFRPGDTITVTWAETIPHPGHFRIAFQPNGETFGIPPVAPGECLKGNGQSGCPGGNCNFPTGNQEGVDPNNGSIVLKDLIADGTLSTTVTLPNMECSNCTLQFIQLMTDKCPYTDDVNSDDIYFNCADITLSNSAPAQPDAGVPTDGGTGDGGNNPGTGDASGGCSSSGGLSGLAACLAVVALAWRRRRVSSHT